MAGSSETQLLRQDWTPAEFIRQKFLQRGNRQGLAGAKIEIQRGY
jgi:hypothetical protein